MLRWPEKSTGAIRRLFEPLQDVDVYVEDAHDEAFYKNLLRRIVGGKIRIERVFSLCGRKSVVDKCEQHQGVTRRAFFIIDGDLEFVKGLDAPLNSPLLYRIQAYCIENLIVCEEALSKILTEECPIEQDVAKEKINFEGWRRDVVPPLARLFAAYATLNNFRPEVATVSKGAGPVVEDSRGGPIFSLERLNVRVSEVIALAHEVGGQQEVDAYLRTVQTRILEFDDPLSAVSGKDIVLPLLLYKLRAHGCKLSHDSLRRRLAMNCRVEPFSDLANSIMRVAMS